MQKIINNTEIDFIYLKIPVEYINVYRKLLIVLSNINEIVSTYCSKRNKSNIAESIYGAWFMFQAAIASNKLNEIEKANKIIEYINKLLNNIYFSDSDDDNDSSNCICEVLDIDEEGMLKVASNHDCCCVPTFYVDPETGDLMSEYDE